MAMMLLVVRPSGLSVKLGEIASGDGDGSGVNSGTKAAVLISTGAAVMMHKTAAKIANVKKVPKRAIVG